MTVSALVVTVYPDHRDAVTAELSLDSRISIGSPQSCQLPVVLDTGSSREGHRLVEQLREMPGVSFVNVVMVNFSDGDQDEDEEEAWNDASS